MTVQTLFKQYKNNYLIVHRNSLLMKDILAVHQSIESKVVNEYLYQKIAELRPRYYRL